MTRRSSTAGGRRYLALVVALTGLATAVLFVTNGTGPLQWAVAIPFLLVLPGYAFLSAVRPAAHRTSGGLGDGYEIGEPGWPIRLALAMALSVVIVGVIGVALNVTVGVTRGPAVLAIGSTTILFAIVASLRRETGAHGRAGGERSTNGRSASAILGRTTLQWVVLLLAALTLLTAVGFAATAPGSDQSFSEFYVLNETANGTLTATDLPETMSEGEGRPLHFGIENHERRQLTYDVVVQSVRVGPDGNVTDVELLDEFDVAIDSGERAVVERTVVPTEPGQQRLQFLLYTDGVPADPTAENATTSLHLWVDVTTDDGSTGPVSSPV